MCVTVPIEVRFLPIETNSLLFKQDNEDVSLLCTSLNNDEIRNSTPLRSNVLEEDRKHFKDLQISNILPKVLSTDT